MSKLVIALTGAKGSGKDYFADIVKEHFNAESVAFADPIKAQCRKLYQLESLEAYDKFKRDEVVMMGRRVSGRHLVRELGMLMRSYDESQFIRYVNRQIDKSDADIILVTDLRFGNELLYFENLRRFHDVHIFKINSGQVYDGHESETELNDNLMDHRLFNKYDDSFKEDVINIINKIKDDVK